MLIFTGVARPMGIVGRDEELAAIDRFLASGERAPSALLVEGEAGIGKTTLWQAGSERAREQAYLVFATRPAEAETQLSFAALGDLLADVGDDVLSQLPAPQRRALEVALLLETASGRAPDQRAVSVAFLSALRALARTAPVLVAVDDVQWLDPASAAVLAFAARRLSAEPVAFLLARRLATAGDEPPPLERAISPERLQRLTLGPLSLGALHHLLHGNLGTAFARPLLRRVHELSGGNPFFALELGRALARGALVLEPGQPLPVSLDALVRGRLASLSAASQRALAAAAAASQPTVDLVEQAVGGDAFRALSQAADAHVVELDLGRIRFTHPLLASAAYASRGPAERRQLHKRLAEAVDDVEERARHLSLAATKPDGVVAAALDEAAAAAVSRGAPAAAADLCERAARLTPPDRPDEARRRSVDAAIYHFESGDSRRARTLLEETVSALAPGTERAAALTRLARVRSYGDDLGAAASLFRQAIDEARDDARLRAVAHEGVAACSFRLRERLGEGVLHAEAAADLARSVADTALLGEALASKLLLEAILGRETAPETLASALALGGEAEQERILRRPEFAAGVVWMWWDELERARAVLGDLYRDGTAIGDESSLPYVLFLLTQVECRLGEFEAAAQRAAEAKELCVQSGQEWLEAYADAMRALADAYRGHAETAREAAERSLPLAARTSSAPAVHFATTALAHLELSLGRPEAAYRRLRPLVAWAERERAEEPGATPFLPDAIEALVELGRLAEAERVLTWYEANATRLARSSALAASARLRGLLAASRSDLPAARTSLEDALAEHEKVPLPLERARTLLTLGATHRRAKGKRAARETLERALAVFQELGASVWSERARAELARIGGRARVAGELTATERRVAALVAEGKATKQVAAELFVSTKTVEGHLSKIYAKLGVRSRAELARKFARERASISAG